MQLIVAFFLFLAGGALFACLSSRPFASHACLSKNGRYLGGTWDLLGRNMGGSFSIVYLLYI